MIFHNKLAEAERMFIGRPWESKNASCAKEESRGRGVKAS